ncbi:MAG: hypothetical protein ACRDIZ_01820 [Actinomycetota bacterium]
MAARMRLTYLSDAVRLLVSSPDLDRRSVDTAMRLGERPPRGPFEVTDHIASVAGPAGDP